MKDQYSKLATTIVESVTNIIGPVAITLANQVPGIKAELHNVSIEEDRDPVIVIEKLVKKYESIIGPTVITLAKNQASSSEFKGLKLPSVLKISQAFKISDLFILIPNLLLYR